MTTPAKFTTAASLMGSWFADLQRGEPPVRFRVGPPFDSLDLRPGRMIIVGGAPGSGKTAAALQIAVDLLRQNESARLLVANVEMTAIALMERIIARLAYVPLEMLQNRTATPKEIDRVRIAIEALKPIAGRIAFLAEPFTLEHLAEAGSEFEANVILVDYLQRFGAGDSGKEGRERLEYSATILRRFCDAGALVFCLSACARQKNTQGSSYGGLNLASFRGSSEIEYSADSAYLLTPPKKPGEVHYFCCAKNRNGEPKNILAMFSGAVQDFTPAPSGFKGFGEVEPAEPPKGKNKRKGAG